MKLSERGVEFLVQHEGLVTSAYQDVAGYWTVGVGHLLSGAERASGAVTIEGVAVPYPLTREQCLALLRQDAGWAERCVSEAVHVALDGPEFDALVAFVFNVGPTNFKTSRLLKRLNAGNYQAVPDELRRWVRAGGKEVAGLKARREAECALWNTP